MTPTKPTTRLYRVAKSLTGFAVRTYRIQTGFQIQTYVRGRRVQRYAHDQAAADRIVEELIADLDNGFDPTTHLNTVQRADYLAAKKLLGKVTMTQAAEFYALHHGHDDPRTIADIANPLLETLAVTGRTQDRINFLYDTAVALATLHPGPMCQCTPATLESYLKGFPHPATRNARRRAVQRIWNHAKSLGVLAQSKPTAADLTVAATEDPKDPETVTPGTLETLLRAALAHDKRFLPFLVLGGFLGLRTAEIQRLRWSDITADHVLLASAITKTRRRRAVPIPPNAIAWLALCRPPNPKDPVLPLRSHNMFRELRRARPDLPDTPPNFLRHTAATMLLASGLHAHEVSSRLGNSPDVLESHYKGLATRAEADRYFSIYP